MARRTIVNNIVKTLAKMEEVAGDTPILAGSYEYVASQLGMSAGTFKEHISHLEYRGSVSVETFEKKQNIFFLNPSR